MKRLLSVLSIIAFTAIPNVTFAQDGALVLEEVVVTATKKEENVQDIAQTVHAIIVTTLVSYFIRDLIVLSQNVSGVAVTQIYPRRAKIIIR